MKKFLLSLVAILATTVSFAQSRTTLWEGEQTMDSSWPSVQIPATEFASAKVDDAIVITISKADNAINTGWAWGPQVFINGDWSTVFGAESVADGTTDTEVKFVITADELAKIQAASEIEVQGMNLVVVKVELESAVPTVKTVTPIWEGECTFGNWEEGFSIAAEKFASAVEGDQLEFVYTTESDKASWWQFKTIFSDTEEALTSNAADLNDWDCATVQSGSTSYKFPLNAYDIDKLKQTGMYVNGYYNIVTAVNLIHTEVVSEEKAIYVIGNVEGLDDWNPASDAVTLAYDAAKDVYAGTITVLNNWEGNGWVGFSSALGADKDDWGTFNAARIAVSSDYVPTLGEAITFSVGVDASFQLAAGTYEVEISLTNQTIKFTAASSIAAPAISAAPSAYYSLSGARLAAPAKGVNIVKYSDGSVKKVLVK